MLFRKKELTLQVYEKTLTLQIERDKKQTIARVYDGSGQEVICPFQFEYNNKGFQQLRHWVKQVVTVA